MPELSVKEIILLMPQAFQPEKARGVDTTIHVEATGEGGGEWTIQIRDQKCQVQTGLIGAPRLLLSADEATIRGVFTRKIDPTRAFMSGKIKIKGDISMAMKLASLFKGS